MCQNKNDNSIGANMTSFMSDNVVPSYLLYPILSTKHALKVSSALGSSFQWTTSMARRTTPSALQSSGFQQRAMARSSPSYFGGVTPSAAQPQAMLAIRLAFNVSPRAYFQTGILPPPGTVCQPDVIPFGPGDVDVSGSKEVGAMVQNYVHIGKTLYDVGGGLGRMGLLPDAGEPLHPAAAPRWIPRLIREVQVLDYVHLGLLSGLCLRPYLHEEPTPHWAFVQASVFETRPRRLGLK
ncbi:hypothetical protein M8818_003141, partial [Zalaria obscura]